MQLKVPTGLVLPRLVKQFLPAVKLEVADSDGMYQANDEHYLSCGASALNTILSLLNLSNAPDPRTILDFGAGAGRVTRWLRAAFSGAEIDTCDLVPAHLEFCQKAFGARTWVSSTDPATLEAPGKYDLIWLGSVITHLPADATQHLIDKLVSWCRPGGIVILSLHGRFVLSRQNSGEFRYIDQERWEAINQGFHDYGYGYSDYENQKNYGISVTKLTWAAAEIANRSNTQLISLSERAWDGHHDVLAFRVVG